MSRQLETPNQAIKRLQRDVQTLKAMFGRVGTLQNPDWVHDRRTVDQSIPNNSLTSINFNQSFPTGRGLSRPSQDTYEIDEAGVWTVNLSVRFDGSTAGSRRLAQLTVNGSNQAFIERGPLPTTNHMPLQVTLGPTELVVGDEIQAVVLQNSGVSLNVVGSSSVAATQVSFVRHGRA